jgi:hypothetical protein
MKFAVIAAFCLTACSLEPPRLRCEQPCAEHHIVRIDPSFSTAEQKEVWRGLRAWTRASSGSVCFDPQARDEGYNLVVIRGTDQRALRPYINDWDQRSALYKDGTIVVAMSVVNNSLGETVAHEAGHSLGLNHAALPSVMYYKPHEATVTNGQLPSVDRATFMRTRCR